MHDSALFGRSELLPQLPQTQPSEANASHCNGVPSFVTAVDVWSAYEWMRVRIVWL